MRVSLARSFFWRCSRNDGGTMLSHLLDNNRRWARKMTHQDPGFFHRLATRQTPEYLWIGCSDSRVPANEIVGLLPGELLVHRNVGNVVVHTDMNCLSVLQYAIDFLKVRHVIVCGHHGCAGVRASLKGERLGLVDNWLRSIADVYVQHQSEIDSLPNVAERMKRLSELNTIEQVGHVCQTTVVQDAWQRGQRLAVHGLIYDVADGLLQDLGVCVSGSTHPRGSQRSKTRSADRALPGSCARGSHV
jgi:carbonic anhydrase